MFNLFKLFSSSPSAGTGDADHECTSETKPIVEEPPKIMTFHEVNEPSTRVGDIFWLPSQSLDGKKCLAVNFDFDICRWSGMPKLLLNKSDPIKGTVILGDGTKFEAKIELLVKKRRQVRKRRKCTRRSLVKSSNKI